MTVVKQERTRPVHQSTFVEEMVVPMRHGGQEPRGRPSVPSTPGTWSSTPIEQRRLCVNLSPVYNLHTFDLYREILQSKEKNGELYGFLT
jgi:hypothetical protein